MQQSSRPHVFTDLGYIQASSFPISIDWSKKNLPILSLRASRCVIQYSQTMFWTWESQLIKGSTS